MQSLAPAEQRDVKSLQNWLNGTGCLARDETSYLKHQRELVSLAPVQDHAVLQIETWVEDQLIGFYRGLRRVRRMLPSSPLSNSSKPYGSKFHDFSTDRNIYVYSGSLIERTAKALLLFLITLEMLMPVVICNLINAISVRIVVVIISTVCYLLTLSGLTNSKTIELIVAAAT